MDVGAPSVMTAGTVWKPLWSADSSATTTSVSRCTKHIPLGTSVQAGHICSGLHNSCVSE